MKERAGPSGGEPPCYTLINFPSDAEQPSEMQLKIDLGTNANLLSSFSFSVN